MTMNTAVLQRLATSLRDAVRERQPIPPVRDALAAMGVAGAYAVQDINTQHALESGRRLTGRKIGLTSKSVQQQLGVDAPDFGMLFADMELAPTRRWRPGACCSRRSRPNWPWCWSATWTANR